MPIYIKYMFNLSIYYTYVDIRCSLDSILYASSWQCTVLTVCIPPNPQDGLTPLMLAAGHGHLPVARLLVETYHCDVNEEDGKVSGWVGGNRNRGASEHSTCINSHM